MTTTPNNIRRIDPDSPDEDLLTEVVAVLDDGGLVVAPTETRYGLLARADRAESLRRVYETKQRPMTHPTALFIRAFASVSRLAEVNQAANLLAQRFLPGPLTLVLRAREDFGPPVVIEGKLGIRVSASPLIAALMDRVEYPLTATSANLSGSPEQEQVDSIAEDFGDAVGLYLDGGKLSGPVSTVVDCTGENVTIAREGAIAKSKIENVLA